MIGLLLIACVVCAPLLAQHNDEAVPFSKAPYRIGERLTYHVSFSSFIDAAHVELQVVGRGTYFNRDSLLLRAHVETTGIVNAALYSINNDYTTYIDPETGLPFRSQQTLREGGRTADTSSEYNAPLGTSAIPARLRTGEFPGTYDMLSTFYRLRALPLAEGATYRFQMQGEDEMYQLELKVTGHQLIKTNVGSFSTIVTQVRAPNNGDANSYHARIYFSDDERHVPVLLTAQHKSGEIRAELASSDLRGVQPVQASGVASPTPSPVPSRQIIVPPQGRNPVQSRRPPPASSDASNNAQTVTRPQPTNLPFKVGEQLNYNVYLGSATQPVGTASFLVRPRAKYFNHDGMLYAVRVQTVPAAQRIFFVNDQINSYVDPVTLLPFRSELNLVEGTNRVSQIFTLDQDHGLAASSTGQRLEIPVGTHDFVSVAYALRSFNLDPPKRNAVSILVHNRPRTLFITSLRRETITLGSTQVRAIQISLTTDDPVPDKYQLRLWVSDDSRRLPLRITGVSPLGPVRADLAIIPLTEQ
ncbi:MAG: hypothetical protein AUG51_10045 [Acidobacteria bacterium 13_1_20CM_3_53_8]|nr:MAG: hypothetical protein AUG51_10045 [Acidobacteria bacterium 13_1_20CM_3_53_8]